MLGIYFGILSLLQSPAHAFDQLAQDGLWVGLVALGFGLQVGFYTRLRIVGQLASGSRATAITGAGTGTSTVGMLACCAHHLTDVVALLGLAGASGLGGVSGLLTAWKIPIILFGLSVNGIGLLLTLRELRKCRDHVGMVRTSPSRERVAAPSCH